MYIVTRLISDIHFHITGQKFTFKTYNYRHCDTRMSLKMLPISPKTADYISSGGVIATLLGCTQSWSIFHSAKFLKVFRRNHGLVNRWLFTVSPYPVSRRVSIDSRVWNRNADGCFFLNVCLKIRCVPRQGAVCKHTTRLHTLRGRNTAFNSME